MDRFQTHNIDFDIEDDDLMPDDAAAKRLANALARIKKDVPDVYITYTLSTSPSGMGPDQIKQIQAAKDAGLVLDGVLLMTMNFGTGDNIKASQDAIAGGAKQVSDLYGISIEDAKKMMGMVPAIGVDDLKVVLDLKGAKDLTTFAKENQLSTISYWNFMRDFPGGDPSADPQVDKSSSPDQKDPAEFFKTMLDGLAPPTGTDPVGGTAPAADSDSAEGTPSPDLDGTSGIAKIEDIVPTVDSPPADFQAVQKAPLPALDSAPIPTTSEADAEA
ncbi:hypothetical protein DL96DRAFT_1623962 [Flagelloscypha sp. PMI_526]|nr:hypothetical protein DL96DRAFT_1623962 [Flagelloscypha sp. PMI_526]